MVVVVVAAGVAITYCHCFGVVLWLNCLVEFFVHKQMLLALQVFSMRNIKHSFYFVLDLRVEGEGRERRWCHESSEIEDEDGESDLPWLCSACPSLKTLLALPR